MHSQQGYCITAPLSKRQCRVAQSIEMLLILTIEVTQRICAYGYSHIRVILKKEWSLNPNTPTTAHLQLPQKGTAPSGWVGGTKRRGPQFAPPGQENWDSVIVSRRESRQQAATSQVQQAEVDRGRSTSRKKRCRKGKLDVEEQGEGHEGEEQSHHGEEQQPKGQKRKAAKHQEPARSEKNFGESGNSPKKNRARSREARADAAR